MNFISIDKNNNLENLRKYRSEQDLPICFYLNELLVKKSTEREFTVPYYYSYHEKLFHLLVSRTKNSKLEEIRLLIKLSFEHKLNILALTFLNIIEYFGGKKFKNYLQKELKFEVKLDDKPDILVTSEKEKVGVELAEVSLLKLTKGEGKDEKELGDCERFMESFLTKELEKFAKSRENKEKVGFMEHLRLTHSINEIETAKNEHVYSIKFRKTVNLDNLIENIVEEIRDKNNNTDYEFQSLWLISPLPFAICIEDSRKAKSYVVDEQVQKVCLLQYLFKKIFFALKESKIKFKFDYLVISFRHSPRLHTGKKENIKTYKMPNFPENKEIPEWIYETKRVCLPNLYFQTRDFSEKDVIETYLKGFKKQILELGYDEDYLIFNICIPDGYFYPSNVL